MLIDQPFITAFTGHITDADGGARLAQKTSFWQQESCMLPILSALNNRINQDLTWDQVEPVFTPLLTAIKPDRQRKYSVAIKFLLKSLMGAGSHMFAALRLVHQGAPLAEKLSKSQQRYTIPLAEGDAGHGLCLHMTLLWLKEQLSFHLSSNFPQIARGNVVGSKDARKVATAAMASRAYSNETIVAAARQGLTAQLQPWNYAFQTVHQKFVATPELTALLVVIYSGQHAVAIVREPSGSFLFYDSNAGSYRIRTHLLQTFLLAYNDTCLPLKWPAYAQNASTRFTEIYTVN